jgi:2,3-bisphosphoglycerate-independent phosphoglycerate mutase
MEVKQVKEYRFAVVMRGEGLSPDLEETDPQRTGVAPLAVKTKVILRRRATLLICGTSGLLKAKEVLADQPKANCLTLRGFSTDPGLPSYQEMYGLKAACIAVYPMYRGVSQLAGYGCDPV